MAELIVRRLLIDMEAPISRHWCGGDAFRTALFNALSMSFPVGEQFFIDSVRAGFERLPADKQDALRAEVQGFIGQEATHRRLHGLYNGHLERLGLVNGWERRGRKRLKQLEGINIRHWLAITAAYEHFTAILANWLLHNADVLGEEDGRLKILWLWHSSEESEHKSTAIDLYRALGGDEARRIRWFKRTTVFFLTDALRQTLSNLRSDGSLWKRNTWKSAWTYLFGSRGLVLQVYGPWRAYLQSGFHPSRQDAAASVQWLKEHRDAYIPVGQDASASHPSPRPGEAASLGGV